MRRFSFLMILLVVLLWLTPSHTLGQQDPNDPGVADTLYLAPYKLNEVQTFPSLVHVRLLVTHDLATATDSLTGIVVPICYLHSNPTKYCSTAAHNNDLCLGTGCDGMPPWVLSIFRHQLPDSNWLESQAKRVYPNNQVVWDTRILDLGNEVSHWWLSLAASGTQDQGMWGGSRILIATMTLWVQDTMTICIDTCFWPPSGRLKFGVTGPPTYVYFPQLVIPPELGCFFTDVRETQDSEEGRPSEFSLSQNYPNPFNPATNFKFSLSKPVHVTIEIFNIVGQKVRTLVDEQMKAGVYLVDWDGKDEKGNFVSSGIYFYRMKAEEFSDMKKMVLVK